MGVCWWWLVVCWCWCYCDLGGRSETAAFIYGSLSFCSSYSHLFIHVLQQCLHYAEYKSAGSAMWCSPQSSGVRSVRPLAWVSCCQLWKQISHHLIWNLCLSIIFWLQLSRSVLSVIFATVKFPPLFCHECNCWSCPFSFVALSGPFRLWLRGAAIWVCLAFGPGVQCWPESEFTPTVFFKFYNF